MVSTLILEFNGAITLMGFALRVEVKVFYVRVLGLGLNRL
jgi:hypothetical protein